MPHVLVAFYSRTGTTRKVARRIATALDADVLAITDAHPRKGVLGFMRSAIEAVRSSLPEIGPVRIDPIGYDLVVLGTPVWAGHVASPMRRYLHDHHDALPRVAFFCTMAGSNAANVFSDMSDVLGHEPIATCAIGPKSIDGDSLDQALDTFVGRLGQAVNQPPPPRGASGESRHVGL